MPGYDFYHAELMEHYRYSPFRGTLDQPTIQAEDLNPSCGDRIEMHALVADGTIQDIKFRGSGCVLSQAAASMLAEKVRSTTPESVLSLTKDDMLALVEIKLGPNRLKCVLLALDVLQQGIRTYQKNHIS